MNRKRQAENDGTNRILRSQPGPAACAFFGTRGAVLMTSVSLSVGDGWRDRRPAARLIGSR
jgi:hypothetical protein